MRELIFVVGVLTLASSGHAGTTPRTFETLGAGAQSCGSWTEDRRASNDLVAVTKLMWVLGYATAYNEFVSQDGKATQGTDSAGMAAWIDSYCLAHPLDDLSRAAHALVHEMETRKP